MIERTYHDEPAELRVQRDLFLARLLGALEERRAESELDESWSPEEP
jgi:hypothetical protein